jgi:putative membrane protein
MDTRYIVASIHLLTLGLGVYSCWTRAVALRNLKDKSGLDAVFKADNLWALAAFFWLATGLWRAFGGLEKGSEYYLHNAAFLVKMSLFAVVVILELKPMITLVRWRIKKRKAEDIDLTVAAQLSQISYLQLMLLIPIVMMAAAMARGIFY